MSDVLPTEKEARVRSYQERGHKVAWVEDGINGSAAAGHGRDIGIAIGQVRILPLNQLMWY